MSKEILEQLFDSPVKVRLLKLFLRNPGSSYSLSEAGRKIRADFSATRRQIKKLESIRFLKSRRRKGKKHYSLNGAFDFFNELRTLVLKSSPASRQKISEGVVKLGIVKLVILSGVFVDLENSRADFILVGEAFKKKRMNLFFKELEAEVGKEIDYVVLSGEEFKYRYDMFDRFIRDVLEKPHVKLLNKMKI